jgi:hypothetical protein
VEGQSVGKYRVGSRLGRGGMGSVYKAVDETLHREVAIKRLHPDLSDPDVLKRFRAEALALARLNHPNIATLYELTEQNGELLMIMEFVRGKTLEMVSQQSGPMPIDRAVNLCAQALDALAHAHREGIVHRDLKPANLMLTTSGLVKVMDFGLARMAGTEHLTNNGFMVGTPAYMSPEQVLGGDVDGRADLYAIGVVFYRLLTTQLPFNAESGIAMVQKQINDRPTPVRQLRTELPQLCEEILTRALAKSPQERYQTADEFKAALCNLVGGTLSSSSIAAMPIIPAAEASDPTVVLRRPRRSGLFAGWPGNAAGVAAACVLLLVGIPATALIVSRTLAGPVAPMPPAPAPAGATREMAPAAVASPMTPTPGAPRSRSTRNRTTTTPSREVEAAGATTAVPAAAPLVAAAMPTVTFGNAKLFVVENGKPRDRAAAVRLGSDSLQVLDGGKPIESAAYRDVVGVFLSHSREPRWAKPDGTPVPLGKVGGKLSFLKGSPDWITVQTKTAFIPIRVPDEHLARLISELETRTASKLIRLK